MNREEELNFYIKALEKRHATEIENKNKEISGYKESNNLLKYALKGACAEHLHVRYIIDPELIVQNKVTEVIDPLVRQTTGMMAHTIEEKLGNRYKLEKSTQKLYSTFIPYRIM